MKPTHDEQGDGATPRSRTVWCASYPKSGNTWVRSLAQALRTGHPPDINRLGAEGHASDDLMRGLGLSVSDIDDVAAHGFQRLGWALADRAEADQGILRKTHTAWLPVADGYPANWQPPDAKAIYIIRDPRAVAVSWAHHIGHSPQDAVDIMATERVDVPVRLDDDHRFHPGNWSSHVQSWTEQDDIPTLVLRYEDLAADPITTVTGLARWLGVAADETAVSAAVEACAFERLAVAEIVHGFAEAAAPDRVFFRRGEVAAWASELERELIDRIEVEHAEMMRRFGYLE